MAVLNPVVARFGGDEFCAFYLEEEGADSEKLIRNRAGEETERLNLQTDAGLYVDKKNKEASVLK